MSRQKKRRLIREAAKMPGEAYKVAVCPTGMTYQGCKIALLVPEGVPAQLLARQYAGDMARLFKRSGELTVRDVYRIVTRRQAEGVPVDSSVQDN